jgi:hypothetical protein
VGFFSLWREGIETLVSKEGEIQDVRSEEMSRGKRPIDIGARRRRLLLRKKFIEATQSKDEGEFRAALTRDLGQMPGSREFEASMTAWRKYHGRA